MYPHGELRALDTPLALPPPAQPAPRPSGPLGHILAVSLAVAGGALGIIGAFVQEIRAGGFLLLPFIGAPVIEEALKPAGVYILLARWPHLLRGRLYTATLCALAGLAFGVVESLIYVNVYVGDPSGAFVLYRFTVTLAVHAVASFIVGLGIDTGLREWAAGRSPLPKRTRNFYIAGAALHAIYNTVAFSLEIAGVVDF